MKKDKKLGLSLNKKKITELSTIAQKKIVGGTYPSHCAQCGGDPTTIHCTNHYPGC